MDSTIIEEGKIVRKTPANISIVISLYNEQNNLAELFSQITNSLSKHTVLNYELIFVNDGSSDNSFQVIKSMVEQDRRVKLLNLARNFGHEIAMSAGLDYTTGDCVIFMDADLQHPPSLLP